MSTLVDPAEKTQALAAVVGGYEDVAAALKCSRKHVERLVRDKKVPGVIRQGRLVRFHLPTVKEWIDKQAGTFAPAVAPAPPAN